MSHTLYGQLNLTKSPNNNAFIPQNRITRSASFRVAGLVTNSSYQSITIRIKRNGLIIKSTNQPLKFNNQIAEFIQNISLKTGKYLYDIVYELHGKGVNKYIFSVTNLLVGDVYLIQGQSNAVAASYNPFDTKYYSPYLKSYGTSSTSALDVGSDTFWHPFNAVNIRNSGSVGQWGAVMARHLLDSFDTPICILNGAVGGTRIDQHQPNPLNHEDLNTIYGRLLYRTRKANLDSFISGILYFQGESDRNLATKHDTGFTNLFYHWKKDYPNFSQLYVVQVREGCGNPTLALREVQRQFEFKLPNCKVISANGLNNHDGCHYGFINGYEKLGLQVSKLLGRDFYWAKEDDNIDPPNIDLCYYSDGFQKEITLVMHNPKTRLSADLNFQTLFNVEGDPSVNITAGRIENNKVILSLNKSSCLITGLSYNGKARSQPWVKNEAGMALISFHNVPIKNHHIPQIQFACKNQRASIGIEALKGVSYSITRLSTQTRLNQSFFRIALTNNDSFKLLLNYDSLSCSKKDSAIIYVQIDSVSIPNLGKSHMLCQSEMLNFSADSNQFKRFRWSQNNVSYEGFQFNCTQAGTLNLLALSSQGCFYQAQTEVLSRNPKIHFDSVYKFCEGDSISLNLSDTFQLFNWNNESSSLAFTIHKAKRYYIEVSDSFGCVARDSITTKYFEPSKTDLRDTLCLGDVLRFDRPKSIQKWEVNGIQKGTFILFNQDTALPIQIEDQYGCSYHDTISIKLHALPDYPQAIDTIICPNSEFTLHFPVSYKDYRFESRKLDQNKVVLNKAGIYSYSFKYENYCTLNGQLNLQQAQSPKNLMISDTSLCQNDSIIRLLDGALNYRINGRVAMDSVVFRPNNEYFIEVENSSGCTNTKRAIITELDCVSHINNISEVNIYPMPFKNSFRIELLNNHPTSIEVFNHLGQRVWFKDGNINSTEIVNLSGLPSGFYYLRTDHLIYIITKD